MKNFRTFNLAVEFYKQSSTIKFSGHLKDQFQRAALSIPLNLAEGRGKATVKDQKRFFSIAFGSLRECQAILILSEQEDTEIARLLDKLAAHLYLLMKNS